MVEINFNYSEDSALLKDDYTTSQRLKQLYEIDDYRDVLINARMLAENLCKQIFKIENLNPNYYVSTNEPHNLRSDTKYLRQNLDYPLLVFNLFDEIRRMGNEAVHDSKYQVSKEQAWHVLCAINDIMVFLLNSNEGKNLNYLRPDMIMASSDFKKRQIKQVEIKQITNNNAEMAQQVLQKKKRRSWKKRKRLKIRYLS